MMTRFRAVHVSSPGGELAWSIAQADGYQRMMASQARFWVVLTTAS
jgi:hypothetical protein